MVPGARGPLEGSLIEREEEETIESIESDTAVGTDNKTNELRCW